MSTTTTQAPTPRTRLDPVKSVFDNTDGKPGDTTTTTTAEPTTTTVAP
jgi:hypothetical protein